MSSPLTGLVKAIDAEVNRAAPKYPRKLGTFVIIGDRPGLADQFRGLTECESLQRVTLAIAAAPPRYTINPNADVTVVIYTPGRPGQNRVTANFTLREGELDDTVAAAIVGELGKVLPK